jgi:hypothetical protein
VKNEESDGLLDALSNNLCFADLDSAFHMKNYTEEDKD